MQRNEGNREQNAEREWRNQGAACWKGMKKTGWSTEKNEENKEQNAYRARRQHRAEH